MLDNDGGSPKRRQSGGTEDERRVRARAAVVVPSDGGSSDAPVDEDYLPQEDQQQQEQLQEEGHPQQEEDSAGLHQALVGAILDVGMKHSSPAVIMEEMTDAARHRLTVPSGGDPLAVVRKTVAGAAGSSASSRSSQYFARLTDFRQMDIQSARDQMKTLLSTRPHVVYKTSYYRKQTKNHWARDDPAFAALQLAFLVISSIFYAVSFRTPLSEGIAFMVYSILFNWLGCGFIVASVGREIANRHLTDHKSSSHVRQSVEWLYAFDIHCNAFFPVFVLLYGVQFFLLPLVLGKSLFALLLSNTLYAVAFAWYWYITHLGYRALPFLSQTKVFLFPIAAIALVYVLNLIGYPFGLGWNASRIMAHLYFD